MTRTKKLVISNDKSCYSKKTTCILDEKKVIIVNIFANNLNISLYSSYFKCRDKVGSNWQSEISGGLYL